MYPVQNRIYSGSVPLAPQQQKSGRIQPDCSGQFLPPHFGSHTDSCYFARIIRSLANSSPLASSNFFKRSSTSSFFFSSPDTS